LANLTAVTNKVRNFKVLSELRGARDKN